MPGGRRSKQGEPTWPASRWPSRGS